MSGRAGRRGLDSTGMVIIACSGDEPPEAARLSTMILGRPTKLESQFRLTYNMILNLLRVEALKVEEMIKRSFSENSTQKLLPDTKRLVDENEQRKLALRQLDCTICGRDLEQFYDVCGEVITLNRNMMLQYISKSPAGNRALAAGRVIIVNNNVSIVIIYIDIHMLMLFPYAHALGLSKYPCRHSQTSSCIQCRCSDYSKDILLLVIGA